MRTANVAKSVLLISVLAALLAGCTTTTRIVEVRPQCVPPPKPHLLFVDAGELWDAVGDATYRKLEENDARVADWAEEMHAMLTQICAAR